MIHTDMRVSIGALELAVPVVCASGTFGFGGELRGLVDYRGIGAITTKTITREPRAGNPPPRVYETEHGVLNSVGLENPGIECFLREKLPIIQKLACPVIVSVGGFDGEEYALLVRRLDAATQVQALEINLSCPNIITIPGAQHAETRIKKIISQDAALTFMLVKQVRALTKKTLIVKITPETANIADVARAVQEAGADAVALVNTFFGMAINIQTRKPYLGNVYGGYSGPAIKPMAVYRTRQVAAAVCIPLIAGGGIQNADDAIEFILAGATAVSLGTINLTYPNAAVTITRGVQAYCKRHAIRNITALRGMCT